MGLPFIFRSTSLMIFSESFRRQRARLYHTLRRTQHLLIQIIWIVLLRKKQMEILTQGRGSFRLASPSYSITPFADLVRRRSRTVCQQEFVLELTLLISLLRQRTTVSCWVLEMRPLLLFTFHKPDDFLGEFQTAAGEIIPHFETRG